MEAPMDRTFFDRLSIAARTAIAHAVRTGLAEEHKGGAGYDPVTEADRAAERALRQLIEQHYPDHGIWGEEMGWTREGAPIHWSLDPIDGTRAFICGLPSWAVLAGVIERGRQVGGMIDLPALDERLVAVEGTTLRNGELVRTSGCTDLATARFSTTDPFLFEGEESARVEAIRRRARIARFGLDACAYARVATGHIDLVVENSLKPHDYDALIPVVRGAGGHIGDWKGGEDFAAGRIIAAASRPLYDTVVTLLSV